MAEMTLGDVYKSVWDILKEGANRHSEARTMALCYRSVKTLILRMLSLEVRIKK